MILSSDEQRPDPLLGIDDEQRRLGPSGTTHRVLEKFNMTRRVDDDVLPPVGAKEDSREG